MHLLTSPTVRDGWWNGKWALEEVPKDRHIEYAFLSFLLPACDVNMYVMSGTLATIRQTWGWTLRDMNGEEKKERA